VLDHLLVSGSDVRPRRTRPAGPSSPSRARAVQPWAWGRRCIVTERIGPNVRVRRERPYQGPPTSDNRNVTCGHIGCPVPWLRAELVSSPPPGLLRRRRPCRRGRRAGPRQARPPVYVRKQIVHNLHVVRDLESKGAVFVTRRPRCPRAPSSSVGARGGARVYRNAAARNLTVLDATCPLVTKVHLEAGGSRARAHDRPHRPRRSRGGRRHDRPGPRAHDPGPGRRGGPNRPDPRRANLSYLTQTTLSVDETNAIIGVLRERFPGMGGPRARTSATRPRTGRTR